MWSWAYNQLHWDTARSTRLRSVAHSIAYLSQTYINRPVTCIDGIALAEAINYTPERLLSAAHPCHALHCVADVVAADMVQ